MPTKFRPSEFHLHREMLAKVRIFDSNPINILLNSRFRSICDNQINLFVFFFCVPQKCLVHEFNQIALDFAKNSE